MIRRDLCGSKRWRDGGNESRGGGERVSLGVKRKPTARVELAAFRSQIVKV